MLKNMNRIEATAALAGAALLVIGCLVVLRPFVSSILWATVLAYTTWPLLLRVERWLRGRRRLAALTMTLVIALFMVLPFVMAGMKLAENVSRLEELFKVLRQGLPGAAPDWAAGMPWVGPAVERYWPRLAQDTEWIAGALKQGGLGAGKWLLKHSFDFGLGVLQLMLSVVILFILYRDGESAAARLAAGAQRIAGDVSQRLLSVAGGTVRSVVYGIIGTALAQASVATLGFWISGVPSPFLLGLATFVLSLVPVGPPFIWVPATLWLFHAGRVGWGIFLALWGLLLISGIDNVVRPYLISRESKLPFIISLLGALGGVMAFGFIGLFLGPVLLAVGYAMLREYTTKPAAPSAAPAAPSGD